MEKRPNIVRLYKERLNLLLDVAQTINENHSIDELMQEFETLLREELAVGRVIVFTRGEDKWNRILACGVSQEQVDAIIPDRDLIAFSKIENLALCEHECLQIFDAVIPLYYNFKLMGYVLIGDQELGDGISPTLRNLKYIQILANLIIVFIENKKMQMRLLREESQRHELEIASQIQMSLVPKDSEMITTSYLKVRSLYKPLHAVGGDYYDVMKLSPYSVGFCIADVSGKGMGAALLMSNFQAIVRSLFTANIPMCRLVKELNARLNQNSKNDKFITMFIGRYNKITGRLTYVNAGHWPPLLCPPKGGKEIIELDKGCIAIGLLDEIPEIEEASVKVRKGAKLLAFTDGLVEVDEGIRIRNSFQELKDIMLSTDDIDDVMKHVDDMADRDKLNGYAFDDISVLGLEFKRNATFF
ncbi:MAG: SpoIIE family protein phosphatase [Marinilabiliaceae bacterium]|nr:SpoIIE family protein phosphatase [Marinilabiliaceae bacterium]